MKTIEVTVRRRIELHDDQLVYNQWYRENQGIDRVDTTPSVEPFLGDGETLVDSYLIGQVVIAPDPDETSEYQSVLDAHAQAKHDRDLKLLAGVLPKDLPTDEELVAEYFCEPPEPVPSCSECGSTTFRYDEDAGCYNTMDEADATKGVIRFYGGGTYTEGTAYPGLMCDSCGTALETDLEIDFSC